MEQEKQKTEEELAAKIMEYARDELMISMRFLDRALFRMPLVAADSVAAFDAGEDAANQTVTSPNTIPQTMPTGLIPNTGKELNSSPINPRRKAHNPHVETIPSTHPAGTAVLHQKRASSRTSIRT